MEKIRVVVEKINKKTPDFEDSIVRTFFERFGKIDHITISKRYAFVDYKNSKSAKKAYNNASILFSQGESSRVHLLSLFAMNKWVLKTNLIPK